MSVIIYGNSYPEMEHQVPGLCRYFKMEEIVSDGSDPYPLSIEQQEEFKKGKVLFLTHITPKSKSYDTRYGDYDIRRVISFENAMKLVRSLPWHTKST